MAKDKDDKQIGADIPQRKADVLRARDIIADSGPLQQTGRQAKPGERATETSDAAKTSALKSPPKAEGSIPAEPVKAVGRQEPLEDKGQTKVKTAIPRFNLAEEIMAEQRKITAVRRKAPGKKFEADQPFELAGDTGRPSVPQQPKQDRIIAEIVARDIERLCRGHSPVDNQE